ncbi:tigger transposable element-derived protein 4-like [Hydra vulgaris]|uniref:tigger transposable element-derived protein 4-like n=1 Tax=Hydra vulgaris TaxID=6087 RepID=UPI001F5F35CA|nr:tigger transposable element-derived protein 4-like [Hydra vulgaris]
MDSKTFTDYVRRLDAKFNAEGRKVALIIDNCPAHPNVENLKAIQLVFLPPNTTFKTQPMDRGVIRALKTFHRSNVVRRQIKYIDAGKTTLNINILEAMSMLVKSWDAVSTNTVINCFRKAGILKEIPVASINGEEDPFELLEENVKELISRGLVEKDFAVEDYVNIDFDICTSKAIAITDREILDFILINDCAKLDEEIDEEQLW